MLVTCITFLAIDNNYKLKLNCGDLGAVLCAGPLRAPGDLWWITQTETAGAFEQLGSGSTRGLFAATCT
jgi:hypothetical protein